MRVARSLTTSCRQGTITAGVGSDLRGLYGSVEWWDPLGTLQSTAGRREARGWR